MEKKNYAKPFFVLSAICFSVTAISLIMVAARALLISFALGLLFVIIGTFLVDDRGGSIFGGGMPWRL